MTLMSQYLVRTHFHPGTNTGGHVAHWCPGCNELHEFAVDRPFHNGARWVMSGTPEAPTFTPSMNIRVGPFPAGSKRAGRIEVCHYFLTAGRLQFLPDSTHHLAGHTVDLPALPQRALDQVAASLRYEAKG